MTDGIVQRTRNRAANPALARRIDWNRRRPYGTQTRGPKVTQDAWDRPVSHLKLFFVSRAFDIVQPDVSRCGDLAGFRRIALAAPDSRVDVISPRWNTVVGLAADRQLSAFLSTARFVQPLISNGYIDDLPTHPPGPDAAGSLSSSQTPEPGVQIDQEKLQQFCPERLAFRYHPLQPCRIRWLLHRFHRYEFGRSAPAN